MEDITCNSAQWHAFLSAHDDAKDCLEHINQSLNHYTLIIKWFLVKNSLQIKNSLVHNHYKITNLIVFASIKHIPHFVLSFGGSGRRIFFFIALFCLLKITAIYLLCTYEHIMLLVKKRRQQGVKLTCSISSLIMPFHRPLSSWEPYFPSGTRRISYVKPRMLASSFSKSMQNPSKRSFPTSALSDFLSMTYGSSCSDQKDQMKSNGEVSFFNLFQHMNLIEAKWSELTSRCCI